MLELQAAQLPSRKDETYMGPAHKLTTEVDLLRTNLGKLFKSIDGIPLWELLKGITTGACQRI